jgi:hypothetical protein
VGDIGEIKRQRILLPEAEPGKVTEPAPGPVREPEPAREPVPVP